MREVEFLEVREFSNTRRKLAQLISSKTQGNQTVEIEELARQSCQLIRGKEDLQFGLESSEDSFRDRWDACKCREGPDGCIRESRESSRSWNKLLALIT